MTLWSIWRSRNQRIWESIDERPATIMWRGKTLLEEWERAQSKREMCCLAMQYRVPHACGRSLEIWKHSE